MNKKMRSGIIIVALLVAFVGLGYWVKTRPAIEYQQGLYPVAKELADKNIVLKDYVRYVGKDGRNAYELLQDAVDENLVAREEESGVVIESINGLEPEADHFWKLYHNGKAATVPADQLDTKRGDILEWVVERGGE